MMYFSILYINKGEKTTAGKSSSCHTYTKILQAWLFVSPLLSVQIFFANSLR